MGYSSFIRGFFNKKLYQYKKNILPPDLFVKQINSATTEQDGRFHHGQIIQTWVVYSSTGKSFIFNSLINVKIGNNLLVLENLLFAERKRLFICGNNGPYNLGFPLSEIGNNKNVYGFTKYSPKEDSNKEYSLTIDDTVHTIVSTDVGDNYEILKTNDNRYFVKGDNNSFAYNASLAVSKNPGKAYNPMLIYGGVGLGKTHLMESIGNMIYQNTNNNIIYVTAENFTNEFVQSIGPNINKFKNKYRSADVLLLDDIHFLMGKKETQEELFNTFEALYNSNKQLVFTCDRPVTELKDMNERLVSRFGRGLSVDLQAPQYETRLAILQKKAETEKINVKLEVIELIAKNVCSNVRDLEAALTKLKAFAELMEEEITLEKAQHLLRDTFSSPKQGNISIEIIQKVVADKYGLSVSDLKCKKRNKNIAIPRQIVMYLCRELTDIPLKTIGILLSTDKNETIVKYTLPEDNKTIFSSEFYILSLTFSA